MGAKSWLKLHKDGRQWTELRDAVAISRGRGAVARIRGGARPCPCINATRFPARATEEEAWQ